MCVAYITQSLDKGTLGSASIMGWQASVGAKGQDYALTSTVFWCGVIVGEPLVNQFIRRMPVAKVLAGSMMVWSVVRILALALLTSSLSLDSPSPLTFRASLSFVSSWDYSSLPLVQLSLLVRTSSSRS